METVSDSFAIQQLNYRYAYYCDSFQTDAWVDCFTPDAVFDETEFGLRRYVGSAQIRENAEDRAGRIEQLVHLMNNHLIFEVTPDTARGWVFVFADMIVRQGDRIKVHCTYKDEYRKVGGDWKISSREVLKSLPVETVSVAR